MFLLIFGIIWSCLSLIICFPFLFMGETGAVGIFLFPTAFIGVGIIMIVFGAKKVLVDYKTSKNGEICFGKVLSVMRTGCTLNGSDEYKAEFLVYIESKNTCERITEVIGFNYNKYPINSLVKVKYYNGDINIISKIYDINECSYSAQYYLSGDAPLSNYEINTNSNVNSDDF